MKVKLFMDVEDKVDSVEVGPVSARGTADSFTLV